ncbi:hypothetical protein OIO90_004974 [Microbotryomycetes sp. JL221]|nr:hypothetical protein OIO90_004974 [Microbotryomycetes sp. JL221]
MSNPFSDTTSRSHAPGVAPGEAPPSYTASNDGHLTVPSTTAGHHHDDQGNHSDYTTDEDTLVDHHHQPQQYQDESVSTAKQSGLNPDDQYEAEATHRPLPEGWRREFDSNTQHCFYVDTKSNPPRSIWVHPFDDPEYLNSLSDKERKEILGDNPPPAVPDNAQGSSSSSSNNYVNTGDIKSTDHATTAMTSSSTHPHSDDNKEKRSFGRKMKDKMTGTTHEQRVQERKKRKEEEMKQYQQYIMARQQLLEAQRSGRYQPMYAAPMGPYSRPVYGYGRPAMMGYPGYGYGQYGYGGYGSPYGYRRPYGGGAAAGGAGLLGGLLVGSLLF